MNNIIRFWNQNRFAIIIGVFIIVFLIVAIQLLNQGAKRQKQNANQNRVVLTEEEKSLPSDSIIGEGSTNIETTKENVGIIEEFVEKCNNQDITGAYNMLTDSCKETLYSTEESFKTGYYDMIFSRKKNL